MKNKISNFLLLLSPNLKFSKQPRERNKKKLTVVTLEKQEFAARRSFINDKLCPPVDITPVGAVHKQMHATKYVNRRAKHFGSADCKVAQGDAVVPSAKSLLSANPISSIHAQ